MSVQRFFQFTCDICAAAAMSPGYSFPPGFVYYSEGETKHACAACGDILVKHALASPVKGKPALALSPVLRQLQIRISI